MPERDTGRMEAHSIRSSVIGESYTLHVVLPKGYADSSKAYPVQYILDSSPERMAMVSGISRFLVTRKLIPETIIVGISHGDDFQLMMKRRMRDFSPVRKDGDSKDGPGMGGAEPFARFIETELFPFVEARYRTVSGDRTIWGHSMGGLFALHLFFHHPEMFSRCIASSPSVMGGMFKNARSWASKRRMMPARLYLSVGSLEDWRWGPEFARNIADGNRSGFTVVFERIENTDHGSVIPCAYARGIATVFEPNPKNFLPTYPVVDHRHHRYGIWIRNIVLGILSCVLAALILYRRGHRR